MIDKRIKSYLENRLEKLENIKKEREWTTSELGDIACCKQTIAFIDSLKEEPVSKDLEEAAKAYSNNLDNICGSIGEQTRNAFKAGAEWGKNQAEIQIKAQSMALAHGCPKESVSEDLNENKYLNNISK